MALLDMPLRTMWSEVQEARDRVQSLLGHLPEDICAATVMTASELIENAIKYGESVPAAPSATIVLNHEGGVIEIVVKNGVADEECVRELIQTVNRIAASTDRMALYIERLRELMTSGKFGGSKLGLYRIGYEGGFDLRCDHVDRVVIMTATRKVD